VSGGARAVVINRVEDQLDEGVGTADVHAPLATGSLGTAGVLVEHLRHSTVSSAGRQVDRVAIPSGSCHLCTPRSHQARSAFFREVTGSAENTARRVTVRNCPGVWRISALETNEVISRNCWVCIQEVTRSQTSIHSDGSRQRTGSAIPPGRRLLRQSMIFLDGMNAGEEDSFVSNMRSIQSWG
jgi:hypothetical protein